MTKTEVRARKIKNRDIPKLQSVFHVMQDIRALEERREWQKGRMVNITQHLSWTRGGGTPQGLDAAFEELSSIEGQQAERLKCYFDELRQAERIINGISSRNMRTFVSMMYIENIPPRKIRDELNMSEWAFRRACECIEQACDMKSVQWSEKYIVE